MKITLAICFFMVHTIPVFAAEPTFDAVKAADEAFSALRSSHTIGDMQARIEGKVDPILEKLIKEKFKDAKNIHFSIERVSKKRILITAGHVSVSLEYGGMVDGSATHFIVLVNNQDVEIDPVRPPLENLSAVLKAFPEKVSFWFWLVPSAEAQVDYGSLFVTGGVAALAVAMMWHPSYYYPSLYGGTGYGGYCQPAPVLVCGGASAPGYIAPPSPWAPNPYSNPYLNPYMGGFARGVL